MGCTVSSSCTRTEIHAQTTAENTDSRFSSPIGVTDMILDNSLESKNTNSEEMISVTNYLPSPSNEHEQNVSKSATREATNAVEASDIKQLEKAAVMIQRVARGVEARGHVLKRRASHIARDNFEKSLDVRLSPAENASKALLELAAVVLSFFSCFPCYNVNSPQRLNLNAYDMSVINYAVQTLQVYFAQTAYIVTCIIQNFILGLVGSLKATSPRLQSSLIEKIRKTTRLSSGSARNSRSSIRLALAA